MAIRFACKKCGHPFEVDDRYAGQLGRCKHCGHTAPIPGPPPESRGPVIGLKLRPIEGEPPDDAASGRPAPGLKIRPVPPEDLHATRGDDPDEPQDEAVTSGRWRRSRKAKKGAAPYVVLDPDHWEKFQARPFHLNPHYETRLARIVSRTLRGLRNWLFVISFGFLVLGLIGFLFKIRALLHVAATAVVATNVGMLVTGLFYLVTLPFKDSLAKGLGALFIPPYAVYYWFTHWSKMRKPVLNTLRSFTPIALVGLAYLFYVKAPVIERGFEKVEQVMEKQGQALERLAVPDDSPPADPPLVKDDVPETPAPEPPTNRARPF